MDTTVIQKYSYRTPFLIGVICSGILFAINAVAEFFHIYSLYHWFDNPMHLFGGFSAGLLTIGIARAIFPTRIYEKTPQFVLTVVGALCVGIVWEVVEAYYNVSVLYGGNFWFDTYKDLLMDTLGGILSYICFHPSKKNQ